LWEAEFKCDVLINLAEEISRQHSIQAVLWALLAVFTQVYNENEDQNAEQKASLKKKPSAFFLIFICLMMKEAGHLFMFVICIASLVECLYMSFAHFLIRFFLLCKFTHIFHIKLAEVITFPCIPTAFFICMRLLPFQCSLLAFCNVED
jgi:hypothetical protein